MELNLAKMLVLSKIDFIKKKLNFRDKILKKYFQNLENLF
jgi:hypothetical protein